MSHDSEIVPRFSVELDREQGAALAAPGPVDPAPEKRTLYATVTGTSDRRPIVPAWLRSRQDAAMVSRWAAGYLGHSAAYHVTRSPKYAAKAAYRSPVGVWRVLVALWRWVFTREQAPLRAAAVEAAAGGAGMAVPATNAYLALEKVRNDRVRVRLGLVVVGLVVLCCGLLAAYATAPRPLVWIGAVVLVAVLGRVGSPADRPLLDVAVVTPRVRRLSAEVVQRAVVAAGGAKTAEEVAFPVPIMRDGPGWRATVDLPYGRTAGALVEKREELSSGLDLPLGQVWPEGVPGESTRRLVIWVADVDVSEARQPAWPLLRRGTVDLFDVFPFGTGVRGNGVALCLMFANMIIGSVPRVGKTFALRLVLLAAALDVTAEIHAVDLKGTGDLDPLAPVAHTLVVGDDDDEIETLVTTLRRVHADMRRRIKVIRSMPRERCPESKVTREMANDRSLRLHPVVLGMDECQIAYEHPIHGEEIERICVDLIKRGPAAGIMLLLATQRPDAKSIPPGVSSNAVLRFGLRMLGWRTSDMVLGDGMHKAGWSATQFRQSDRGVGVLVGASDTVDAEITRTYRVDSVQAAAVVQRARAAREAAGRLTGMAAGIDPDRAAVVDLLDDLRGVIYVGEAKIWSETVVERLAALRPDTYGRWTPDALAAALKPHGIETKQLNLKGIDGRRANRRGVELDHVLAAIERRSIGRA